MGVQNGTNDVSPIEVIKGPYLDRYIDIHVYIDRAKDEIW